MNRAPRLPASLLAAACMLLLSPARADDAELFLGDAGDSPAAANVLFIIDTSGSMDAEVETQAPWDASQSYSGCYKRDVVYFAATGGTPACDSKNFIKKSVNYCAAARAQFTSAGYFNGPTLLWDKNAKRWVAPASGKDDRPLECEADRGIDGDGGSKRFAADGAGGPWASSSAQEPSWSGSVTLYDGNWLNWNASPPTTTRTRLEVVQEVVDNLAGSLTNVNVGIMRFNEDEGGRIVQAVKSIETNRAAVIDVVDDLSPDGFTPLSETLFEASRYFFGGSVDYGDFETSADERSVAASRVGNRLDSRVYLSPVTEKCARNFIILLTDGEPNEDGGADAKIRSLPGFSTLVGASCDGSGEGACLDDLADYLRQADTNPSLPGVQNVVTHVIGFTLDLPLLESTAARGGGEYYLADDTVTLTSALSGIVASINDSAGTFAAPTIPVNAFNRTQNLSDIYLSVFQATDRARWPGNLKKYRFTDGVLTGRDGRPAIDAATGTFARDAWSFWSATADGDRVADGGAASRLPDFSSRRLYTNLDGGDLGRSSNRVATGNATLTAASLGVADSERAELVEWALGRDTRDADGDGDTAESRREMADAFHVQPATIIYGGSADAPVANIYLATNDGYLHAVDSETGVERWAFIPSRLLPRLRSLYLNETTPDKQYGLDGELRVHIVNDDGQPGFAGAGERAMLLFGMGRGGNGVFAIDVTSRDAPQLLWEISADQPDFADLGQTWSTPVVVRSRVGGTVRTLAVFGGGYDTGQDNGVFRTDSVGNAIYVVDVLTGERVWSAGGTAGSSPHDLRLARMQHSIPAPVRALDLNGDGLADRFYVGDTGGRLWRFDIVNGNAAASLVEGGVLASLGAADLGASPPASEIRRFYEAPDVVPTLISRELAITINIGSGYRGHPLDTTVDEQFFAVRDFQVFGVISSGSYGPPISVNQLVDITEDPTPALPDSAAGWRLRLDQGDGEKILGESVTLNNVVFFTSFTPGAGAGDCVAGTGVNRLYAVSLLDGSPLTNFDTTVVSDTYTVEDRSKILDSGIPITGVFVYQPSDGSLGICAGTECLIGDEVPGGAGRPLKRTYWFQDESQ
jgi:type IV pilus assembly protein PilY1